jgi:hypothetical protein
MTNRTKEHESRIFDTSTVKGVADAERYKARLENNYASVNVYAIGFYRVQIVGQGGGRHDK